MARFFTLVAALCFVIVRGELPDIFENVVILDGSNFSDYIYNDSDRTLVFFYEDTMESWGAIPQIQRAATIIKNNPDYSNANIAAMKQSDDFECQQIFERYNIERLPMLKYFRRNPVYKYFEENNDENMIDSSKTGLNANMVKDEISVLDYTSGNQETQIVNWLKEYKNSAIETIENSQQFKHLKRNKDVIMFGLGYNCESCLESIILSEVAEMYRNVKKDSANNLKFGISYSANNPTKNDIESINNHIELVDNLIVELTEYSQAFGIDHVSLTENTLEQRLQPLTQYLSKLNEWKEYLTKENNQENNGNAPSSIEPLLIVIKKFDEQFAIANIDFENGHFFDFFGICDFLEYERYPLIQELSAENYVISEERELGYAWIVIEYDKTDYIRRVKTYYNNMIAPRYKGRLIFYVVNAHKYIEHVRWLGVPWIPGVMIELKNHYKYLYDPLSSILDVENTTKFWNDFDNSDLPRFIKSQSYDDMTEMENAECHMCSKTCKDLTSRDNGLFVENLNGYDLIDILQYRNIPIESRYSKESNILVEYYAGWDTRSRKFVCEYEKIAKYFSTNDTIMVAKIESTENDIPYGKVDEYPRFVLYKYSDFEKYLESNEIPFDVIDYGNRPIDDSNFDNNDWNVDWMLHDSNSENDEKSFYKWKGNLDLFKLPTMEDGGYGTLYEGRRNPLSIIEWMEKELGVERIELEPEMQDENDWDAKIGDKEKRERRGKKKSHRIHSVRNLIDQKRNEERKQIKNEEILQMQVNPTFNLRQELISQMLKERYDDSDENVDPFYNGGKSRTRY